MYPECVFLTIVILHAVGMSPYHTVIVNCDLFCSITSFHLLY
jgi:hypothetical protein